MDLLEDLENQGCLERLEGKVHQEQQECLVQRVQTDQEVHLVTEDLLEELECQVSKDQKDQLEQMVLQDLPDHLDYKDHQVLLEQEVKEEKKVHLVNRGLLVLVEDQET